MRKIIFSFLIFLSLIAFSLNKITKDKVVLAINCGGNQYTSTDGQVEYSEDKYYDKGSSSDHGLNYDISGTNDALVYQTERWSSETMTYSLPLSRTGKYTLILKFSEVYFSEPKKKVFDIALGNKVVVKNLDIFAKVGREVAYDEYIEFEFKNEKIYWKEEKLSSAYDKITGTLKLKFIKGTKDNPKINAIVLVRGTMENTDYKEKKQAMEAMKRKKSKLMKDIYALKQRHDPDYDYSLEELGSDTFEQKEENIKDIFKTGPGIAIIISVITFFVLNKAIDSL
ncbi:MAG: malectin [archaeon]|nr:malectin [archaeon]